MKKSEKRKSGGKGWLLASTLAVLVLLPGLVLPAAGAAAPQKEKTPSAAETQAQAQARAQAQEKERQGRIQTGLRQAEQLEEIASASSLAKAQQVLAAEDLKGSPSADELATFGGRLFAALYPQLQNPFPGTASGGTLADKAPGSRFFQVISPALFLLSPGPAPDDEHASQVLGALTAADGENRDSLLPTYLRAVLLQRQQKPPETVRPLYEDCLRRDPSFYPAKLGIIETAIDAGSAASEQQLLLGYASQMPDAAAGRIAAVRVLLAAGKPKEAGDSAARALLQFPDSSELVVLRAQAYDAVGDWYQALSVLDSLLRIMPGNAPALALKAEILLTEAGNPDEAMRIASQAEPEYPADPVFPELRGRIFLLRGNSVQAEAEFASALSIDPNRVSALAFLARSAAASQRWQEASGYLERVPTWKRDAGLLGLQWQIAMNLADYDQALAVAQALQKKAGGDEPLVLSVRTLIAAGRTQEARDLAAQDLKTASTPAVRSTLYVLHAEAAGRTGGAPDAVLADLRAALQANPDDEEALLAIADALSKAHEYRKALGYLRHARDLSPDDAVIRAKLSDAQKQAEAQDQMP